MDCRSARLPKLHGNSNFDVIKIVKLKALLK